MADKNKQKDPRDWTLEDIYNLLMYDIEPELMTDMIPQLDEIYKRETKEEHQERVDRYNEAFDRFFEKFDVLMTLWKDVLVSFKKSSLEALREKVIKGEAKEVADIERTFEEE